ncbi:MAG: DUF4915 domain-containing protein [Bacteroidia bacterium]
MSQKEILWDRQHKALRRPEQLFGATYSESGITEDSLKFTSEKAFNALLKKLGVTLIVSREYENLLISLSEKKGKLEQTFFHLPHPSGLIADRKKKLLYVAATRNPNQIVEFRLSKTNIKRLTVKNSVTKQLIPNRVKVYPGEYYFHDLALCNGELYANSVGMNSIIKVDIANPETEKPVWWPKCIERKGKPDTRANYIQLNSIAMGRTLNDSYFSASGIKMSSIRPGDLDYPVDKMGVIFSGKTRDPIGFGLTRPHSARLYKGKIWVANSGYGEVGLMKNGKYTTAFKLKGWTRGLCFIGDHLFVGVSRVLPRFKAYAPGIDSVNQICSVVAIDLKQNKIVGEVKFPYGNQIFAIDYFLSRECTGFPFHSLKESAANIFSTSI